MILRLFAVYLVLLTAIHGCFAQNLFVGWRSTLELGSHEQRFGMGVHATLQFSSVMMSLGSDVAWNYTSLGERKKMWESRTYAGTAWYFNDQQGAGDFEMGALKNPFTRSSSFGYAYLWYWDNAATQQTSGLFRGEYQGHSLALENDFFAGQGKDRFRTASLRYRFRGDFWSVHSGLNLWTGETAGVKVQSQELKGKVIYFKDISSLAFGRTSHGIFFGGIRYGLKGQSIGVDLGMDSEKIRNTWQNKIAHHGIWHQKHPEKGVIYPMLNSSGNPTMYPSKIRLKRPYFRLAISGD